jgi:hypothetical protein
MHGMNLLVKKYTWDTIEYMWFDKKIKRKKITFSTSGIVEVVLK